MNLIGCFQAIFPPAHGNASVICCSVWQVTIRSSRRTHAAHLIGMHAVQCACRAWIHVDPRGSWVYVVTRVPATGKALIYRADIWSLLRESAENDESLKSANLGSRILTCWVAEPAGLGAKLAAAERARLEAEVLAAPLRSPSNATAPVAARAF